MYLGALAAPLTARPPTPKDGSMKRLPLIRCLGCVLTAAAVIGVVAPVRSNPAPAKIAPGADAPGSPGSAAAQPSFGDVQPVLAKYCIRCHNGAKARGDLNLEAFKDQAGALAKPKVWEKVNEYLHGDMMPPKGKPKPSEAELDTIYAWIETDVLKVTCNPNGPKDPGRVTIRRLNRAEYDNTIRDLVGVSVHASDDFPSDDVGYGFDNNGDVLSMSPILAEKYLAAAEKVIDAAWKDDAARKRILIAKPGNAKETREAARKILKAFADRAWRRPATDDEIKRLFRFIDAADRNGDPFDTGVQLALEAILTSPNFLFRVEIDKEPGDAAAQPHAVNDWELATRLSYFLWSSMPDDELFAHARQGDLHQPEVFEAQMRRMLKDPKSHALVENFADQWLLIRNLKSATPDPAMFPTFDESLRSAMQKETETVLRERDARRPQHSRFYRLRLHLRQRTAGETLRHRRRQGERLPQGDAQGRPPRRRADAGQHPDGDVQPDADLAGEARQVHPGEHPRHAAAAAARRRAAAEGGPEIDRRPVAAAADGAAPGQPELRRLPPAHGPARLRLREFRRHRRLARPRRQGADRPVRRAARRQVVPGRAGLKAILKAHDQDFAHCLTEKMLTYALGRGLERTDRCTVDDVTRQVVQNKFVFSSLVLGIVKSDPFLMRRKRGG